MSTITAIETQKRNPKRANIHIDGKFAFSVTGITAAWLKVGQQMSDEQLGLIQANDLREKIYQQVLHFLSYRPRSSEEIRLYLKKQACEEDLVDEIINRLQESRLINDQDFARAWVENRNTFRPRSKSALRMELRRKGLDDEIIQMALADIKDESILALKAARKQAHRYTGLEWLEFRRKLGGFLARRGFSYATLSPVVSQVWNEIQAAQSGEMKK